MKQKLAFLKKLRGKSQRYDLPLNRSHGTGFVVWVMAMMVYLATVITALFFALDAMTDRWTDGIALKATIEIPHADTAGLSADVKSEKAAKLIEKLKKIEVISSAAVLSDDEIAALVEPWLGVKEVTDELPLPTLIALELKHEIGDKDLLSLTVASHEFFKNAEVDTHKKWLDDMQAMVKSVRLVVFGLGFIIIITAVSSVSGAARSRLAIHKAEVELLHIMGASDAYIAAQFERQSGHLSLVAGGSGFLLAMFTLIAASFIGSGVKEALLPDYSLSPLQWFALLFVPVTAIVIAMFSARVTVMRALKKLP